VQEKEFRDRLDDTLALHGFRLTPAQLDQFVIYWRELKRWNSRMNLTSINDDAEIIVKHFLDSLSVLHHFSIASGDAVIDIGTGAGFPGLPIRIYETGIRLALVESDRKKVSFLRFLSSRLNRESHLDPSNIRIVAQRAEACARQKEHIHAYDWALTRYVASLEDSITYCLPLLKPNGTWVAYKSPSVQPEILATNAKLKALGVNVELTVANCPIVELQRAYVAIRIKDRTYAAA
jgi:16S rRNA (guanine527-N7)-methyltransferase